MYSLNDERDTTALVPDAATVGKMKLEKVSVCISVQGVPDTEDDVEELVKTSRPGLESLSESGHLQNDQTTSTISASLVNTSKVESAFKFDLGGFAPGPLSSTLIHTLAR